jgi:hypothetical protein
MGIGKSIRIVLWFGGKMGSLYGLTVLYLGVAAAILARLPYIIIAQDAVQRWIKEGLTALFPTRYNYLWLDGQQDARYMIRGRKGAGIFLRPSFIFSGIWVYSNR